MITVQCTLWHTVIYPDGRLFSKPSEEIEQISCMHHYDKVFFSLQKITEDNIIFYILKQKYEFRT